MTHLNAPLTPEGRRRLAVLVVEEGWPLRRGAERFQCSAATAKRWADRYRAGQPLTDRSSRPHTSPTRLPGNGNDASSLYDLIAGGARTGLPTTCIWLARRLKDLTPCWWTWASPGVQPEKGSLLPCPVKRIPRSSRKTR